MIVIPTMTIIFTTITLSIKKIAITGIIIKNNEDNNKITEQKNIYTYISFYIFNASIKGTVTKQPHPDNKNDNINQMQHKT